MRTFFLLAWLVLPVAAAAYHYGPGQKLIRLDDVDQLAIRADQLAQAGQWPEAVAAYGQALEKLPSGQGDAESRLRLKLNQARLEAGQLVEAHEDLESLIRALEDSPTSDPQLLAQAREAQARTQFYLTWVLRLEGASREEWEPQIDSARQTWRHLAEEALAQRDPGEAERHEEDLESAIRLARMDLSDLEGLDIPSCCKKSGNCRRKCKNPKPKNQKQEDIRSAGSGPPPDQKGS